jgi:hypothetical protein
MICEQKTDNPRTVQVQAVAYNREASGRVCISMGLQKRVKLDLHGVLDNPLSPRSMSALTKAGSVHGIVLSSRIVVAPF